MEQVNTEHLPHFVQPMKFTRFKGIFMVLAGATLWGLSGTAAQVLMQRDGFDLGWLVTLRMGISGLLLLVIVSFGQGIRHIVNVWRNPVDAFRLILFAIVGLLGVQYSYFAAIQTGNAATATLLQYLGPVFITIYVALRMKKMPTWKQQYAVILAVIGTALLVTNGNFQGLSISGGALTWGLISAFTAAFYTLYPKHLIERYGAATIVGWAMFLGSIGLSFKSPIWRFPGHRSLNAWFLVMFVVLFGTLIAFYLYIASLRFISASETSLLGCAEPLSAAIVSMTFLNVNINTLGWLGGACILGTVIILARNPS